MSDSEGDDVDMDSEEIDEEEEEDEEETGPRKKKSRAEGFILDEAGERSSFYYNVTLSQLELCSCAVCSWMLA